MTVQLLIVDCLLSFPQNPTEFQNLSFRELTLQQESTIFFFPCMVYIQNILHVKRCMTFIRWIFFIHSSMGIGLYNRQVTNGHNDLVTLNVMIWKYLPVEYVNYSCRIFTYLLHKYLKQLSQ